MNRLTALLLSLLLLLFITSGCKKTDPSPSLQDSGPSASDPGEEQAETGPLDGFGDAGKGYSREDGLRFDLPDDVLKRYVSFVTPFNVMPEEFSSPSELSDFTLIFTAAAAIQVEFVPSDDGMSSAVELSKIESRIREYFGPDAKLSDSYAEKDYSPYEVDLQNARLIQYFAGNIGGFFLPYALVEAEEGYELWLIDLMDPLFFNDSDNQNRLFSGQTVDYEEIKGIAAHMQYNIYNVVEQSNGRLMLRGFRYENYKNIDHFLW